MSELLIELLSEEIPAAYQARAAEQFKARVTKELGEAGLAFDEAQAFVTPRRLVLVVRGLPKTQPDRIEERRGPRVGAPDKAIQGFLKSVGLQTIDEAEVRETPKGKFYFAVVRRAGKSMDDVLGLAIYKSIILFDWEKSMRWAYTTLRWVRPLKNILAVFYGNPLKRTMTSGHPDSFFVRPVFDDLSKLPEGTILFVYGGTTWGHRFLAPEPITVTNFADYRDKLRAAHVMLDAAERRRVIEEGAARLADAEGLVVRPDPALVAENAGLVEWPVVRMGTIDDEFLSVPDEVLISAMRGHQKYFALLDQQGRLAPHFILVANIEGKDDGQAIVAGNERVLRARLADAKFFWDQDRKRSLASRLPDLDKIVFHAKLGSVGDKAARIAALAAEIAPLVPGADPALAREAGRLSKCDLTTEMVGEFPELQGIMGRYYAREEGLDAALAEAIGDHYAPQGPNDRCPTAPVSVAVALADKIDTLVGFFAIDQKPTGSKDPYALRRAALGVIRLILENKPRLPLLDVFASAFDQVTGTMSYVASKTVQQPMAGGTVTVTEPVETVEQYATRRDRTVADLLDFFADRLKVHLREAGARHDLIAAVFAAHRDDDLVRLMARVAALGDFLAGEDGANLLVAYRRAANIVRIEEKRDGARYDGAPDPALLAAPEEKAVAECLFEVQGLAEAALAHEEFATAMAALARLRAPVDDFFEKVTVNCDDAELRRNRLRLLARIRAALDAVADFSRIEG